MAPPDLRVRAVGLRELMDAPDCDPVMLDRTYARFRWVNLAVSGWRGIYRRHVRSHVLGRSVRILDIGSGGGDLTRRLARWAERDGRRIDVVGVDADARATAWAAARAGSSAAQHITDTAAGLAARGERFDVVVSNHLLHHLDDVRALLDDSDALLTAGGIAVHADIARSRRAYALFDAGTRPLRSTLLAGSFIREDGLTSIRRAYTVAELAGLAPVGWTAVGATSHRALLVKEAG